MEFAEKFKFPSNYSYRIIKEHFESSNNFSINFRIAEIKDESSALEWIKEYQEATKIVWRVARTFKYTGRNFIYRKDFRCQHKTDKRGRVKEVKLIKNTDCNAFLKLIVERYFDKENLKPVPEDVKQFPCQIELVNVHNHALNSAAALRLYKMATSRELPSENSLKQLSVSEKPLTHEDHIYVKRKIPLPKEVSKYHIENAPVQAGTSKEIDEIPYDNCLLQSLESLFSRIKTGMQENPEVFKPAVLNMMKNEKRFASTETGLVSALHNFGKYSGPFFFKLPTPN